MRTTSNKTFGVLSVLTVNDWDGIFITVMSGMERVTELSRNFAHADRDLAVAHYKVLRVLAQQYYSVRLVIEQMKTLEEAAQAVIPDTIEELTA